MRYVIWAAMAVSHFGPISASPSSFGTLEDASMEIAHRIAAIPAAETQEFIALVYARADGTYGVTEIQTQGERGSSSYTGPVPGELAAIVHNHPATRTGDRYPADRFSPRDVLVAIKFNVPSYIIVMPDLHAGSTAEVRRYDPRPSHKGMAKHGEFVANLKVPVHQFSVSSE